MSYGGGRLDNALSEVRAAMASIDNDVRAMEHAVAAAKTKELTEEAAAVAAAEFEDALLLRIQARRKLLKTLRSACVDCDVVPRGDLSWTRYVASAVNAHLRDDAPMLTSLHDLKEDQSAPPPETEFTDETIEPTQWAILFAVGAAVVNDLHEAQLGLRGERMARIDAPEACSWSPWDRAVQLDTLLGVSGPLHGFDELPPAALLFVVEYSLAPLLTKPGGEDAVNDSAVRQHNIDTCCELVAKCLGVARRDVEGHAAVRQHCASFLKIIAESVK
jgi:predicted nucleic acid-binding Zn ribbon protein